MQTQQAKKSHRWQQINPNLFVKLFCRKLLVSLIVLSPSSKQAVKRAVLCRKRNLYQTFMKHSDFCQTKHFFLCLIKDKCVCVQDVWDCVDSQRANIFLCRITDYRKRTEKKLVVILDMRYNIYCNINNEGYCYFWGMYYIMRSYQRCNIWMMWFGQSATGRLGRVLGIPSELQYTCQLYPFCSKQTMIVLLLSAFSF